MVLIADSPAEHPRIRDSERRYIETSIGASKWFTKQVIYKGNILLSVSVNIQYKDVNTIAVRKYYLGHNFVAAGYQKYNYILKASYLLKFHNCQGEQHGRLHVNRQT